MFILNNLNNIVKVCIMNILVYVNYIKLIDYKQNNLIKTIVIICFCLVQELISLLLIQYLPKSLLMLISYLLYGIIIATITKTKYKYSVVLTFISLTITYLIYMISIAFTAVSLKLVYKDIPESSILILLIGMCIEIFVINLLFKMERFKNGIPFLKSEEKVNNIGIIGVIFIGIVLIIYSIIPNTTHTRYIFVGLSIEAICLFIWIKKKITIYYKQKLKEQTVADLQNEIKEKDNKINEILEENKAIATINHKYSNRIKALEEFSSKIVSKPELVEKMKTEFGEDYTAFAAQIKRISQEYSNEMKTKITKENAIPKTGIFGIDTLL